MDDYLWYDEDGPLHAPGNDPEDGFLPPEEPGDLDPDPDPDEDY